MRSFDLRAPSAYVPLLMLVLALAAPYLLTDPFHQDILISICIFGLLGVAWNILGGYAGQLSLGHAAYFGVGAYTSTLLLVKAGLPTAYGMLLGGLMAMLVSIPVGLASFRLRGPYFAIATIATAETLRLLALKFRDLTFGAEGTTIPFKVDAPIYLQFSNKLGYYYLALGLLLLALLVTFLIERSRLGYYLVAVGQDEDAAEAVGIRAPWVKQQANFVSAFFTGLAGTVYVQYIYFIQPDSVFGLQVSIDTVLVAIVGGVGTLFGPVIGSLVLITASSWLQAELGGSYPGLQLIAYALVMIVIILTRPDGLVGLLRPRYQRLLARLPGAPIDGRRRAKDEPSARFA
ncbi:MAG: branched-chain amino acid ABC transporter permease [Chloroflexi bacterium]|nr:branched-chain amino acid ABC transporter permease [Chloroflexota bacterium]